MCYGISRAFYIFINKEEETMEKILSLAKNRGFVFQGSEIYGGLANTWDYGPLGIELKNNVKKHGGKIHSRITI